MRVNVVRMSKAAASGFLLVGAPGVLGCVAEEAAGDEALAEANDALSAGTATLLLSDGASDLYLAQSSTDEFLRVGETINVRMPGWYLWSLLYPNDPFPSDVNRVKALQPSLELRAFDQALPLPKKNFPAATWNAAADAWSLEATTGTLAIGAKTDSLSFQLVITDAMNPNVSVTLTPSQLPTAPVFGGALPQKSLLFDNPNGTKRQRVIEGDLIVAGAPLLHGVTDWRVEQIVDRSTINTQIGEAEAAGRFGWYTYPIYGTLIYEVSCGIDFHDGTGWKPEAPLAASPASTMLPIGAGGRTMFEGTFAVPSKSTKISMYVHARAFLVADYTGISNITQQWYQQGQTTLMRDSYDNPSGAFSNYEFSVQSK